MNPLILLGVVLAYFILLLAIAFVSSRGANNESFFIGKKSSSWYLVAYGMIGTSLSGVTFMSVPGGVGDSNFTYMQVVFGYLIGYIVVAFVLLPLYYRLNLTSIYTYLQQRFGESAYKTGAAFFLVSRTLGATIRIYLVLNVLQIFMLDYWHIPFVLTVSVILIMILLYTYKGGVKTIVLTDTLQTTFMLLALFVTIYAIKVSLNLSFPQLITSMNGKGYTQFFNTDWRAEGFFLKQILSGMFITISMTGLDQEMMQKNISCRTLKDAQKNMLTMASIMVFVVLLFLFLGGMLHLYGQALNLPPIVKGDDLFPNIALHMMSPVIAIIFVIGLISALFPSADGAITALTSSFCIDMLNFQKRADWSEENKVRIRKAVHVSVAFIFLLCILVFKWIDSKSILTTLLKIAGYTYGPLLGLFSFGLLSKRSPYHIAVPVICILSPVLCYILNMYSKELFNGYQVGFEVLIINATITFLGLLLVSRSSSSQAKTAFL